MSGNQWGPQARVEAPKIEKPGEHWPGIALFSVLIGATMFLPFWTSGMRIGYWGVSSLVALFMGIGEDESDGFASRRYVAFLVAGIANPFAFAAYILGFLVRRRTKAPVPSALKQHRRDGRPSNAKQIVKDPHPLAAVCTLSDSYTQALAGGHVGWGDHGEAVAAKARGGMLVIGPPGSGKSSAVIIPSVLTAPGACVSSSIKGDVMGATAAVRECIGTIWHFDPGTTGQPSYGAQAVRWSPLVGIEDWDQARMVATRMAEPMMKGEGGKGGDPHFVPKARDWVEVLLYAAHVGGRDIIQVADWGATAASEESQAEVMQFLEDAGNDGDEGAKIAARQFEGLIATPDRERGSIISTMSLLLRIYGSTTARKIGTDPNFDPRDFVYSRDTLYITASPDRQAEYAPLIAALLEDIRYAVYARHAAHEEGREEGPFPHATFVLDEANNTAPIPLPAIISEAGGQHLHIIVGVQDLSRARSRWGKDADGFLTLFPTKVVLPGVIEPYTLDALSNAAGEYDRVVISHSASRSKKNTDWFDATDTEGASSSIQRTKMLHQGDIAQIPEGKAIVWEGARWKAIDTGMHWQHPVWQAVLSAPEPL